MKKTPLSQNLKSRWLSLTKEAKLLVVFFSCITLTLIIYVGLFAPADRFPSHTVYRVEEGTTLRGLAENLHAAGLIRSRAAFKIAVYLHFQKGIVYAGDYFFDKPPTVFTIAHRIATGDQHLTPIRITVFEGLNKFETAELLASQLDLFDPEEFIASGEEGYLYPDTYFFLPNVSAEDVARRMKDNFTEKTEDIRREIEAAGQDFRDILILASIVEREANTTESRKIVAGIFLNRIAIDMPLQADVTFAYVNGKNSYTLTREDLQEESPYNTYINRGLPPGPISNPSLDSIRATFEPTQTEYLYFLHDLRGNIYYAEDFEGHQVNRENYLRR